jgi:hypothetical protein
MLNKPMIAIITMVVRIDSPLVVTLNYVNISGTMSSRIAAYRSDMPKIPPPPSRFFNLQLISLMGPWSNHRVPVKAIFNGNFEYGRQKKDRSDLPQAERLAGTKQGRSKGWSR